MKSKLPVRKEAYRLWFEYLRIARRSKDQKVTKALAKSAGYLPTGPGVSCFLQLKNANSSIATGKIILSFIN